MAKETIAQKCWEKCPFFYKHKEGISEKEPDILIFVDGEPVSGNCLMDYLLFKGACIGAIPAKEELKFKDGRTIITKYRYDPKTKMRIDN